MRTLQLYLLVIYMQFKGFQRVNDNFSFRNIRLFFEYHKISEHVLISLNYLKNEQQIFLIFVGFVF